MKPLTLEEVLAATEGTCDRSTLPGSVTRVTADSRDVKPGDLFFAIKGDRFDGHLFVGEAFASGALAAIVRHDFQWSSPLMETSAAAKIPPDAILIRVDDTIAALGRLGRYARLQLLEALTVVAVTGSNGKTTTKSMIAHVLGERWKGRASIKSFNNNIGVPLTLLSVERSDEFVICEVGTNAPGEIAMLARLVEPEVAVITGVSEAHLEGLGSLEKIAEEKLSLLKSLRPGGCAVLNHDHAVIAQTLKRDRALGKIKQVTFGESAEADLRLTGYRAGIGTRGEGRGAGIGARGEGRGASELEGAGRDSRTSEHSRTSEGLGAGVGARGEGRGARIGARGEGLGASEEQGQAGGVEFTVNDRFVYRLNVPGRHNVFNAMAAIAVARRFGMDHEEIAARLATFTLPPMRLECSRVGRLTLVNDAYNANPASMEAAIGVLSETPAARRRVMIVGDMRELGDASERLHRQVAEKIAAANVQVVVAVGERSRLIAQTVKQASGGEIETHAFASTALARKRIVSYLRADDTVLVKGSRALGLEKIVDVIRAWAESTPARSPRRTAPGRGRAAMRSEK